MAFQDIGRQGVRFGLVVMLGAQLLTAGETVLVSQGEVRLSFDPANNQVPVWTSGRLTIVEGSSTERPIIRAFDALGSLVSTVALRIPGAASISVSGRAYGRDGVLAVCGDAIDAQGRGSGFLMVISGEMATTTRLYPYLPTAVAIAPDGTIWTVGYEYDIHGHIDKHAGTLRQYGKSGQFLASMVPQSTRPIDAFHSGFLEASTDRLGWYTGPLWGPGAKYTEIRYDGRVSDFPGIADQEAAGPITGLALLSDGRAIVTTYSSAKRSTVFTLNREWPRWEAIAMPMVDLRQEVRVYGTEGQSLIFSGKDRFGIRFFEVQRSK